MISEKDLQEAIAECKGQRNPNASTCIKLAAFYILKEHMYPERPAYSYDPPPSPSVIELKSGSEFADAVNGRTVDDIMPVMDEAMDALKVLNPAFYASIMRKIEY